MTTTKARPTTTRAWEEYVNGFPTPEAFTSALRDGSFKANQDAYQDARNADARALRAQARAQVRAVLADADLSARNGWNMVRGNPRAPGAGLNGKSESFADFFQAAVQPPSRLTSHGRALKNAVVNYSSTTGEGGGFLIPEEWRTEIFAGPALSEAVVRPRATVIPMSSARLHYPAVDFTTEVGETYGGMIFYWMDEEGTIPDTSAAFSEIALNAWRLGGAGVVPNSTLRDAPALGAWLRDALPRGIRDFEDRAFIKGDGVKKPLGALHAANPSLLVIDKEANQPAASITWVNVLSMFSRMLPESYDNSVWVITPDALPEVFSMALPVGTGGSAVMVAPGAGDAAPEMTMLGRPIRWSRKTPGTLGTQGDISLADFRMYAIGDRQDVRVESSEHAQFLQDKTTFKVIERVDGQPLLKSALTPENGGPSLSAFVTLATRS